jgi:hypothetical protein
MKVYTGPLNKDTAELVKQNTDLLKRLVGMQIGLGKPNNTSVYTIDETIAKYNPGISKDEIKAWVWYRTKKGIPMKAWKKYQVTETKTLLFNWVKDGILFYDATNKELVPYPVFLFGNLYTKIDSLKSQKEDVISLYGQSVYDSHLEILEKAKPKTLSIQNPVESERPIILAISDYTQDFMIDSLRDDTGVIFSKEDNLRSAFADWLKQQPDTMFKKTRSFEIVQYYLYGNSKPRNIDKIEWNSIKKITRDEGERTFKIFLHTALEHKDQVRIDADYNTKYNATAPLQYHKIPIGLEVSKKFMGFDLDIRPAQREGIAFMELVGSGIIAYDVGVGKTITAIIETASAILNGKCKRPIIVVPNPTYKNWIKEMMGIDGMEGILTGTDITLNEWFNLGADYDHVPFNKKVPEKSITLVTYEGAQKIGFNEFTQQQHFSELASILDQSEDQTEREREKGNEKLREIIGVGNKETIADIETLAFDYIVVDEAHNFKNIFTEVKSGKNETKRFHLQGGTPSNRGIKMFFICNYIQRTYGRNVMLLTATPFNNSPLEIYSMLSLVAYDYMRSWNILNIKSFFEQFIQETTEHVIGVDGEIKEKNVVKSFNNRISLQKLINSHINFKTGEEANIPRPCKINLPKTSKTTDEGTQKLKKDEQILTYLELNDEQKSIQTGLNAEAASGADKNDSGKLLRLMGESLNNALSPFITKKFRKPKDYVDFVQNSPKILYTMDCVQSVKQFHEKRNEPVTGQVIYMDRGKEFFHFVKEYLEKELGYEKNKKLISNPNLKVDEVEIISSGISSSKKEKIKDAFNEGVCKIIIGTSTIKEGINLQKKSTVLYNLYPNWNPTDIRQLEGRIWRQKNENGYVRIVMPLMENSMDVFVFQKLDEKTSRINDLWNTTERGNVLDEDSLDPNEVKFALVTDLNVLLRFEKKQLSAELSNKKQILTKQIEQLDEFNVLSDRLRVLRERMYQKAITSYTQLDSKVVFSSYERTIYFRDVPTIDNLEDLTKETQKQIERFQKVKDMLHEIVVDNYTDKSLILAVAAFDRLSSSGYGYGNYDLERYKTTVSEYAKATKTIFDDRGYNRNTNLQEIKLDMEQELDATAKELDDLGTEEFERKLFNRIKAEKEKYAIKGGSLESRVEDFKSLNYLLSYKFKDVDHTSCEIPTRENPNKPDDGKLRRLKLAKAKAKALKLKLKLAA